MTGAIICSLEKATPIAERLREELATLNRTINEAEVAGLIVQAEVETMNSYGLGRTRLRISMSWPLS